jgi:hypothetical protein
MTHILCRENRNLPRWPKPEVVPGLVEFEWRSPA